MSTFLFWRRRVGISPFLHPERHRRASPRIPMRLVSTASLSGRSAVDSLPGPFLFWSLPTNRTGTGCCRPDHLRIRPEKNRTSCTDCGPFGIFSASDFWQCLPICVCGNKGRAIPPAVRPAHAFPLVPDTLRTNPLPYDPCNIA